MSNSANEVRIPPDKVKELRSRTGCGMTECHNALKLAEGDILLAEGYVRSNGLAIYIQKDGMSDEEAYQEWVWDRAWAFKRARESKDGGS